MRGPRAAVYNAQPRSRGNGAPPPPKKICLHPKPWNRRMQPGQRVSADAIKDWEIRSTWIIQMSPTANDWVPWRDSQSRGGHVTTEAEIGVMQPGAQSADSHPKLEEAGRQASPPEPLEEASPCWYLDFRPQASRSVRKSSSAILSHRFVVICHRGHRKWRQALSHISHPWPQHNRLEWKIWGRPKQPKPFHSGSSSGPRIGLVPNAVLHVCGGHNNLAPTDFSSYRAPRSSLQGGSVRHTGHCLLHPLQPGQDRGIYHLSEGSSSTAQRLTHV